MPQIIKIDTFASKYTKIFPFFHIKIWGFPSSLQGCWGQRRPEKIRAPKFKIWRLFYWMNNSSYSQKCNWNVCEMHRLWFNSLCQFCVDWNFCYVVWVSNQKINEWPVCSCLPVYTFYLSIEIMVYLVISKWSIYLFWPTYLHTLPWNNM